MSSGSQVERGLIRESRESRWVERGWKAQWEALEAARVELREAQVKVKGGFLWPSWLEMS